MDWARALARALPWGVAAFEGALIYALLRQHGRTLLGQEEVDKRLARTEAILEELASRPAAAPADPHAGHDHAAPRIPEGLPVGSPAPELAVADLDGRERKLRDFLGEPLLVAFFSPRCGFCMQMAPRLGQLPPDGPRVLVISQGEPEEHRRLASEHGWRCDVLLQKEWQVSSAWGANGTPTGYLVDADGRIASGLAIGADALLRLASTAPGVGDSNGQADGLTADSLHRKQEDAAARARAAGLAVGESRLQRDGLKAGTPAPDFTLPDLTGTQRSLRDFRAKRVLLVFSDPSCGPCQAMSPKLVELQRRHRGNNLDVVMVSRGDPEANRAKAEEHGYTFPVLLQKQWEISKDYAMFATPIAYLIDEQGVIMQDVAVGSEAILKLADAAHKAGRA